jgi:hypothetical protein
MNLNMRTYAISILSGGLIALGSSVAFAQGGNVDNTSTGEAGHGTGCSNHIGGCYAPQESSASGTYQPTTDSGSTMGMSTNSNVNPDNTTAGESGRGTGFYTAPLGCMAASDATPGHCISGGTNK